MKKMFCKKEGGRGIKKLFLIFILSLFIVSVSNAGWIKTKDDIKLNRTGGTITGNLDITDSNFSVGGSTFVVKNGKVGIGGINTVYDLNIKNIVSSLSLESSNGHSALIYLRSNVNCWKIQRTDISDLQFYDYAAPAGVRLMLKKGGNIGINTSTPENKLDVNGGIIVRSSITATSDIYLSTNTAGVILRSPNQTLYRIKVDNAGVLTTESVP